MIEGSNPTGDLSELTYKEIVELLDTNWPWPMDGVQDWFESLWRWVEYWTYQHAKEAVQYVFSWWGDVWDTLKAKVQDVIADFFRLTTWFWDQVRAWVDYALGSFFGAAGWFWDKVKEGTNWLWQEITQRLTWLGDQVSYIGNWLYGRIVTWLQFVLDKVEGIGAYLWDHIEPLLDTAITQLSGFFESLWSDISLSFNWLNLKLSELGTSITAGFLGVPEFFKTEITDPITDFFEGVPEWFGSIFEPVINFFRTMGGELAWFFEGFTPEEYVKGWRQFFKWVSDEISELVDKFWVSFMDLVHRFTPMAPGKSPEMAKELLTLGGLSVGGLAMMTLGGELMHPLKEMGLGNVSAMIGDVVNYRMITGIVVGAVLTSGLRTPLNYYINDLLRPWLPDKRQIDDMRSRQLITRPTFDMLQGYYGLPPEWLDNLDKMTEAGVGYFALSAVADTGYFDKPLFDRDLKRRGYAQEMIEAMLVMYEAASLGAAKGMFGSYAMTGFREGHYGEPELRKFLETLGFKGIGLDRMVYAAGIAYEIDYRSDLLAGYRDAFRKDQITLDEFRASLAELPIMPERIEGYVFRDTVKKIGKLK